MISSESGSGDMGRGPDSDPRAQEPEGRHKPPMLMALWRRGIGSLRAQLSLSILCLVLVVVGLVSLFGGWFINREFQQYVLRQEEARSLHIIHDLGVQYDKKTGNWNQDFLHTVGMYSLYDGYILKVYDGAGKVIWDAENHDMSLCGQIMDDISGRMDTAKKKGSFSAHIHDINQGGEKIGSVSITSYGPFFYSESDFQFINTLNSVLLVAGLLAALLSILVGSLLARRIARPVIRTADIATRIAQGNYEIRFEGDTNMRELKELVNAINHLAGALATQEILRKQLTTDVAHELRTPLAAVGSHLEAMISGMWETTPERLQACHEEIQRLSRLVASLQQLARVEDENLKLKTTQVDLLDVAAAAKANMAAEAAKKNLSLTVEGDGAWVCADREQMVQVAMNLLSNAIKYTSEGGHVRIEVERGPRDGMLRVKDDGIGISKQDLPLIFQRFYRADKSRSRKTGGAGIGLTISAAIVAAHGGTITAESETDQGSCFTVSLPRNS